MQDLQTEFAPGGDVLPVLRLPEGYLCNVRFVPHLRIDLLQPIAWNELWTRWQRLLTGLLRVSKSKNEWLCSLCAFQWGISALGSGSCICARVTLPGYCMRRFVCWTNLLLYWWAGAARWFWTQQGTSSQRHSLNDAKRVLASCSIMSSAACCDVHSNLNMACTLAAECAVLSTCNVD